MYESIFINNFRCFKNFTLKPLAQINLFAGKNGAGKTALLEAFWLNRGYHNPELSIAIDNFRGISQTRIDEFLWSLFRNFRFKDTITIEIKDITGFSRKTEIQLHEPNDYELRINSVPGQNAISGPSSERETSMLSIKEAVFKSSDSKGRETTSLASIVSTPDGQPLKIKRAQRNPNEPNGIFLSSMRRSTPQELAERYSNLAITKEEKSILGALKIIEPRLKKLTVEYRGREPGIFGDFGTNRLFPLTLMGDGIYRLLTIALAITEARNGEVLIDEIENGLHYSVMPDVWNVLATLAHKFKTQIFATTHSHECIQAAATAFTKRTAEVNQKDELLLHRLETDKEKIYSVSYNLSDLVEALEIGLEVR